MRHGPGGGVSVISNETIVWMSRVGSQSLMIRLPAPAKLNLYLRVLGRRSDGYHEIETIFERIDLADELTFEPADALTLTCSDSSLSCGEGNLVFQAAQLLQRETHTAAGARIHLEKRIPVAAGLGGGSSDAATALLGLNQLWNVALDRRRLIELAARLGSDVPCFLSPEPFAAGRGRGERCEPLAASARLAHVLVVPPERLSTKAVYEGAHFDPSTRAQGRILSEVDGFDLTARTPSLTMVTHALRNGSLGELADGLWNDLEPEAIRRCPVIATIQAHLREQGCLGVLVSGSGSAVFGLCTDVAQAHEVAARLLAALRPVMGSAAQAESRSRAPNAWWIDAVQTEQPSRVATPAIPSVGAVSPAIAQGGETSGGS